MMNIEIAIELLKKDGPLPQEDYHSINSELQHSNSGAPCGACGAC